MRPPLTQAILAWKLSSRRVHLQEPRWSPTLVPALAGARLLRSGQHHTLALTRASAVLSAGRPTYGRLGRSGVDPASDDPLPEAGPVEGLGGVQVSNLAAGARQPVHGSVSDAATLPGVPETSFRMWEAASVHILQTWQSWCLSAGRCA